MGGYYDIGFQNLVLFLIGELINNLFGFFIFINEYFRQIQKMKVNK